MENTTFVSFVSPWKDLQSVGREQIRGRSCVKNTPRVLQVVFWLANVS